MRPANKRARKLSADFKIRRARARGPKVWICVASERAGTAFMVDPLTTEAVKIKFSKPTAKERKAVRHLQLAVREAMALKKPPKRRPPRRKK